MANLVKIDLPNFDLCEVKAFELSLNEGVTSDLRWYENISGVDLVRDAPKNPELGDVLANKDVIFKYKNKYYLLSHEHIHYNNIVSNISDNESVEHYYINHSYAAAQNMRMNRAPKATYRATYKKDSWFFTTAPAMAAGMTLAPLAAEAMSNTSLSGSVLNPVLIPALGGIFTFFAHFTTASIAYRLKYGVAPDEAALRKISRESKLRAGQVSVGFFMCEATQLLFEKICGSALEAAWGGALQIGTALCPAEIKLAAMTALGLGFGLGAVLVYGALGFMNRNQNMGSFNWSMLPVIFLTGFVAGAVSSIEFKNVGFSFMATWAALCLFPLFNTAREEGRKELSDSVSETKNTVLHWCDLARGKPTEQDYKPTENYPPLTISV